MLWNIGDTNMDTFKSKIYYINTNDERHRLYIPSSVAKNEKYPLRSNKQIKGAIIDKAVVFFNEEDEEDLLTILNRGTTTTPSYEQLAKKEFSDEPDDYGDPSQW